MNLTNRQLEILQLLVNHNTTQIADILGLSHQTVRNHVLTIYSILRVHNRIAAIKMGAELGLINIYGDSDKIELTDNQIKLLNLLVDYSPRAISNIYDLDYDTLKRTITRLYRDLRVHTRQDAIMKARNLGFIDMV